MKSKPQISVIMPVYNQGLYLRSTIDSVLNQSFDNFEFLIVDDGSTDNSAEIIKEYAKNDQRIIAFYEKNSGRSKSTNFLVQKASAELCAFLDADDLMFPNRLKNQLDFHLNNPRISGSSCDCLYIDADNTPMGTQVYRNLRSLTDCDDAIKLNKCVMCAFTGIMITKSSFINIGGLRDSAWPSDDVDFINRFIENGFYFLIMDEVLMKYRIHKQSITNSTLYQSFVDRFDYIKENTLLRRSGKLEITFQEFMNKRMAEPFTSHITRKINFYGVMFTRDANFAINKKNYFVFFYSIVTAFFLSPKYVLTSINNRLKLF